MATQKKGVIYYLEQIWGAISNLDNAAVTVTDITALTGPQLDALEPGDVVVKVTGKQKHTYTVSYKGQGVGQGVCLTYVDAATVETVAYDYTENGWAYNSTDHTTLTPDA